MASITLLQYTLNISNLNLKIKSPSLNTNYSGNYQKLRISLTISKYEINLDYKILLILKEILSLINIKTS